MKMIKYILVALFILVSAAQASENVTELVYDSGMMVISPTSTTVTYKGETVYQIAGNDYLTLESKIFGIDCDSVTFVYEIVYADSIKYSTIMASDTASGLIWEGRMRMLSPSHMKDTTTYLALEVAFNRTRDRGNTNVQSGIASYALPIWYKYAKLEMRIGYIHEHKQIVRLKVWMIRYWQTRYSSKTIH